MRTTKLFAAILAAGLLISGCRQEEDYVLPDIKVKAESLEFTEQSSDQKVTVTSTRDWMVRSKPDWVAVDPERGDAASSPQDVRITVLDNAEYNRTGSILFSIGLSKVSVAVTQAGAKGEKSLGKGTLEDPYTVEGAVAFVNSLAADTQTTENIYIKGVISAIGEEFSAQYGNATFYIKDPDGGDAVFYVYRTMYLGNKKWTAKDTQIQDGDEVIICGLVVNYKGNTPETVINKSYVYSLNGETQGSGGGGGGTGTPAGSGTLADPYNVAGVVAYVNTLADNGKSEGDVYVKGKVSKVKEEYSAQFGNGTFYIQDEGADGDFYVFRALYLGNKKWKEGDTQIQVGDEVIICGKVTKYVSNYGTTPETVQNEAYLYSLNGTSEGGSGGGGNDTPSADVKTVTVADFIAAEPSKTQKYQLTGKVSGTINTQYGNFDLVDDTGSVYVYGLTKTDLGYGAKNDQSFASLGIKEGDTITIIGYRADYNGKVEVVNAYYVSGGSPGSGDEGGGNDGGGDNGGDDASGTGTQADPYNPAAAYAAAAALDAGGKSSSDVYIKGKISSIKYSFSADYGTATFNISADGTTSGTQFQCYSVYYFGGKAWVEGNTQIAEKDEVIICGKLMNYQDKSGNLTPETAAKEAWIYSLNGKTE